jgi:fructose-1,6-bisphosphatase/inositol monophosphatase family enzyme
VDAVTRLVKQASRELVLPRFRQLQAGDIERKTSADDVADLVTVVDREVETRLTEGLLTLVPEAVVVGEEATHLDPQRLAAIETDRSVWLVDPIDGTRNFARGDDRFGIMVSFVTAGVTRLAWVLLPATDRMFVAEEGGGVWLNGVRVEAPRLQLDADLRGSMLSRFMPLEVQQRIEMRTEGRYRRAPPSGCAAFEYTTILTGASDFVVYYRLLPWDHAAPALILTEAGGRVEHVSGRPYSVRSADQLTVVARTEEVSRRVREWLADTGEL